MAELFAQRCRGRSSSDRTLIGAMEKLARQVELDPSFRLAGGKHDLAPPDDLSIRFRRGSLPGFLREALDIAKDHLGRPELLSPELRWLLKTMNKERKIRSGKIAVSLETLRIDETTLAVVTRNGRPCTDQHFAAGYVAALFVAHFIASKGDDLFEGATVITQTRECLRFNSEEGTLKLVAGCATLGNLDKLVLPSDPLDARMALLEERWE